MVEVQLGGGGGGEGDGLRDVAEGLLDVEEGLRDVTEQKEEEGVVVPLTDDWEVCIYIIIHKSCML